MPPSPNRKDSEHAPQGSLWLIAPAWLVPGLGFFARGCWARGLLQFLMVTVTFAVGLALFGGVTWPSWTPSDPAFNLINNITVVIQLGAGLPALVSLWAAQHSAWAALHHLGRLGGDPENAYYELGSYYLIVAGAVNYFSVCNLSDRLLRPAARFLSHPEPGAQAGAAPGKPAAAPSTLPKADRAS